MTLHPVLTLGLWLVAATVLPARAQLPLRQGPVAHPCGPPAATAASAQPAGNAIVATVTRVAPRRGTLEFTTETGSFVLTTSAALHDLRVGEQVLLCLHEDASGADRVAEDDLRAPP